MPVPRSTRSLWRREGDLAGPTADPTKVRRTLARSFPSRVRKRQCEGSQPRARRAAALLYGGELLPAHHRRRTPWNQRVPRRLGHVEDRFEHLEARGGI